MRASSPGGSVAEMGSFRRRVASALAAALAIGAAPPGEPAPPGTLPPPGQDGWEPLTFRSISRHTVYTPLADGDLRAEADCAASALVLPLAGIDLERTPVLRWRWRVDEPLQIADERSRGGDDFAARVYVMFHFQPDGASLLERIRQDLGRRWYGTELPGSALSFVWSSHEAPGSLWSNPYAAESRMIALERGPASDWREEAVDVVAAYRRAFGQAPPPPLALGIMTDADDSCQRAVARYGSFRFTAADP